MKIFRINTIKNNIFFSSILQTATSILFVGVMSSIITLSILKVQAFNNTNDVFESVSDTVANYSSKVFSLSQTLLYDDSLINIAAFGCDPNTYNIAPLNDILMENPEIQAIKLVINGCEYNVSQGKNSIFRSGSIGYNKLKDTLDISEKNYIWYVSYQNYEKSDIIFVRQIKNPYTNEYKGMLFFQISGRAFSDMLKMSEKYDNGTFSILSSNNLPIVKNFETQNKILSQAAGSESGVISSDGKYYFYRNLPDFNWKIVYCVNKWNIYRILYMLIALIVLLCGISIIVATIFTQHINKTVVMPIQKLSSSMRNWAENVIFNKNKKYDIYEIDTLYDDFENMTQKVTDLINKNYKAMLVQRESELKMLQSQINPHFIFNTLEAINSFALIYDATEINEITMAFSELIEQSIGYISDKEHTFAQEIHLIDCYLTIIRIRYGNKILISKDIDDGILKISMPALILQPIVENSVIHGIKPSDKKFEIKISAHKIGNDLIIKIRDNGTGIEKNKVDKLNQLFMTEKNSTEKSIGLINVNKRLKLLYGDNYHLKISSEVNEFTEVELKIGGNV
ncbi:MAG: sensor histidine kinase [Clostridiales bacterium]|nr:sensor histidine kinase [Clostridiales bacterium]